MRFLHTADIHLGYQQYGVKERFNDFSRVFLHIVDQAVLRRVDFVLLAGDLFEKRTVDPMAMRVAVEGLREQSAALADRREDLIARIGGMETELERLTEQSENLEAVETAQCPLCEGRSTGPSYWRATKQR